jgi:transcriptional antiterminator
MAMITDGESHQEYLYKLLAQELKNREQVRSTKLINAAGFYSIKTFDGFRFDEITLPSGLTPESLKSLDFIHEKKNIIMYGRTGTGKTMLSIALGVTACKNGIPVKFFRTASLVNQLSEAKNTGTLGTLLKKLKKASVTILDEWGYVPYDRTGAQLLFDYLDHELIGICEEILHMICEETGEKLDEEIHIRLTDHIAFTVFRIQNDDKIDNPFMVEIETLYEKEVEIAEQAIELLEETLGIRIPHEEAGFIALHIHSLKTKDSLSNTVKYVYICNSAAEVIEDELGIEIDRKSIDYARFASHIRYAVERILKKVEIKNELLPAIRKTYKHSYRLARLVGRMMEQELYASVPDEEIGYLTLHIERLKTQRLKASN